MVYIYKISISVFLLKQETLYVKNHNFYIRVSFYKQDSILSKSLKFQNGAQGGQPFQL